MLNGKIYLFRHGNAEKAREGQHDRDRPLSARGREQAWARNHSLGGVIFDSVFSSPARRAIDTVSIVAACLTERQITIIPQLYTTAEDGDIGAALDAMFSEIGYAPLQEYASHRDAGAITTYGANTWGILLSEIQKESGASPLPRNVALGGHALLIPAIATAVAFVREDLLQQITRINLEEAGCIVLGFMSGSLVSVEHIS